MKTKNKCHIPVHPLLLHLSISSSFSPSSSSSGGASVILVCNRVLSVWAAARCGEESGASQMRYVTGMLTHSFIRGKKKETGPPHLPTIGLWLKLPGYTRMHTLPKKNTHTGVYTRAPAQIINKWQVGAHTHTHVHILAATLKGYWWISSMWIRAAPFVNRSNTSLNALLALQSSTHTSSQQLRSIFLNSSWLDVVADWANFLSASVCVCVSVCACVCC